MLFECCFQMLFCLLPVSASKVNGVKEEYRTVRIESEQPFIDENEERGIDADKSGKKVTFQGNKVYLIPTRAELFREGSKDDMWYNSSNIEQFKSSTSLEVSHYMSRSGIRDIGKAFTYLYQPNHGVFVAN